MTLVKSQSLRPKQAAEFLGIGIATFWRWVSSRDGFPAGRKLSARCTVFDLHELIAWRDAQEKKGGVYLHQPREQRVEVLQ